ncbi:unnamed protein product [Durusdinium trenchii]|uniref:Uncharacterized protein n=1 Tax=Durusdinium trenchii TaxID=1381693 RepID=A0ABP0N6L5_9DINO
MNSKVDQHHFTAAFDSERSKAFWKRTSEVPLLFRLTLQAKLSGTSRTTLVFVKAMKSMLAVLAVATVPVTAVRMELANRSEESPARLKRCASTWQDGPTESKCCSCGGQYGGGCIENAQVKPCCLAWATDCQSTDPLFQIGFAFDCNYAPYQRGLYPDEFKVDETCKSSCSKVFADHQKAASEWVIAKNLVNWVSNSKLLDKCACGEFNLQTQQCKAVNRWGKEKEKRCCSRLTDCKPGDAWPKEFEELQEVSKAKGQEFDQCFQSCKSRIPELCVADLQKTQEAFRQSLEKDIEALGPRPGDNDRKLLEWQKNYEELIGGKLHQEKLARLQRIYQQLE